MDMYKFNLILNTVDNQFNNINFCFTSHSIKHTNNHAYLLLQKENEVKSMQCCHTNAIYKQLNATTYLLSDKTGKTVFCYQDNYNLFQKMIFLLKQFSQLSLNFAVTQHKVIFYKDSNKKDFRSAIMLRLGLLGS